QHAAAPHLGALAEIAGIEVDDRRHVAPGARQHPIDSPGEKTAKGKTDKGTRPKPGVVQQTGGNAAGAVEPTLAVAVVAAGEYRRKRPDVVVRQRVRGQR